MKEKREAYKNRFGWTIFLRICGTPMDGHETTTAQLDVQRIPLGLA